MTWCSHRRVREREESLFVLFFFFWWNTYIHAASLSVVCLEYTHNHGKDNSSTLRANVLGVSVGPLVRGCRLDASTRVAKVPAKLFAVPFEKKEERKKIKFQNQPLLSRSPGH